MTRNRDGFGEFTLIIVISALVVILTLSAIIFFKNKKIAERDGTINTMKSEKVKDDVVSGNDNFEIEHKTIGKNTKKLKAENEEINISSGKHSITFRN